jgi:hypothetical protein
MLPITFPNGRHEAHTGRTRYFINAGSGSRFTVTMFLNTLRSQVQLLTMEYEKIKGVLASNETAGTLEALEQKLRLFEQNIFHLRECEFNSSV